jgi:hypothetical protein
MGMISPKPGKCEIGFLSLTDSNDPELKRHKPEIAVISVENNLPETLFHLQWERKAPPFNRLRLRLVNGYGSACFFLEDGMGSGQDFREMIDLEHKLNNGYPVHFRRGAFSPILEVTHGDFHTLLLTPETYTAHHEDIEGGGAEILLGHLAFMTAADLHCNSENGAVVLEMRDEFSQSWVKLGEWLVRGRKIFVVANNNCRDEDGKKCYDPYLKAGKEADPETDFHLYYEAILGPQKKYKITCNQSPSFPDIKALPREIQLALVEAGLVRVRNDRSTWDKFLDYDTESTNPTPCGNSGFGASVSLGG